MIAIKRTTLADEYCCLACGARGPATIVACPADGAAPVALCRACAYDRARLAAFIGMTTGPAAIGGGVGPVVGSPARPTGSAPIPADLPA